MSSAWIRRRRTQAGDARYSVLYRRGGRAWPVESAGTFWTHKDARTRRDLVAGELAAGRDPKLALQRNLAEHTTFSAYADGWLLSRVDAGERTVEAYKYRLIRLKAFFGAIDPRTIQSEDVQRFVAELSETLAPQSVRGFVFTLRQVLDYAGVEPNPARDARVRLPRVEGPPKYVPTARQVEDMLEMLTPERWRLPVRVLEQTGMRIGELCELVWGNVDVAESRFLIVNGKTRAARRWVEVPRPVMELVCESCPLEDRLADRPVFPGAKRQAIAQAMLRACRAAGVPTFSPHSLRHRYASLKIKEGVPVTDLAAQLGHGKKSLTLDTYSHVLVGENDPGMP